MYNQITEGVLCHSEFPTLLGNAGLFCLMEYINLKKLQIIIAKIF